MLIREQIIDFIETNRVSTTEVADALGKSGVLKGVLPVSSDHHCVGVIFPIFTAFESNFAVHEQIKHIEPDNIAVVFAHECGERAILGDIIAKYIVLYKKAKALVVDAPVRDVARLKKERYPLWSNGCTPLGCFNTETKDFPSDLENEIRRNVEGGIAVCDDGGVVIIPPDRINEDMLERLERIELQEDLWYFCLDSLKWDTKRIICDREYLNTPNILPEAHRSRLASLNDRLDCVKSDKN